MRGLFDGLFEVHFQGCIKFYCFPNGKELLVEVSGVPRPVVLASSQIPHSAQFYHITATNQEV